MMDISVCLSVYLSVCLFMCLCVYVGFCRSTYLSSVSLCVCLTICMSVFMYYVYLCVCLVVYLSGCLIVWQPVFSSVCLSIRLSGKLFDCLSLYLAVWRAVGMSITEHSTPNNPERQAIKRDNKTIASYQTQTRHKIIHR